MQIRALPYYGAKRGWSVGEEAKEVGSGAVARTLRQHLIDATRRREIDVVPVWRLDRWCRSDADLVSTLRELTELGGGRLVDRGSRSDHAGGSSDGWTAGRVFPIRKGDSARARVGRTGSCTAPRQTARPATDRCRQSWFGT